MAVSHNYSFTRNKNIITFTDHDTDRSYDFNINTGLMTNAATGKQVNAYPAGLGKFLESYNGEDCIIHFMDKVRRDPRAYNIPTGNNAYTLRNISYMADVVEFLMLLDRVQSLGATPGNYSWRVFNANNLRELNTYFKDFVKYCHETAEPTLLDFFEGGGAQYFIRRNRLDSYHLTAEMQNAIYERRDEIPAEDIPYYAYYLGRGVYDFFNGSYMSFSYIHELIECCKKLNIEPPKEDFFRSYINIKREYKMRKREIDAAAIIRNYTSKREALTFEDENFMVVIPQNCDDFKAEADAQHNCVYSMYLSQVVEGKTHVVFVRRKNNPVKSLITCEVKNGRIVQFLEKYNRAPSEPAMYAFKDAYQAHLCNSWDK